ncbi:uncharacterized protein EDB93DRAFT_1075554 [Suillus bovinus]|uniref:uncharacterized protein n=1 Tax=Suillus bovinus TaxID=48563 RepID=UPI001B87A57D|nr:uncharacterized protein EDB93DRAFT_1075554 [Suillus bovinus]KAG2159011.1 hypothetical protein EDB93DRAFT_1075554 [Suillus bovinus]
MALRTQHIPLRLYLNRIGKAPSPHSPHCSGNETITHFLIDCSFYRCERHALVGAMGRKATSLPNPMSIQHLVGYINVMPRPRQAFGEILLPRKAPRMMQPVP